MSRLIFDIETDGLLDELTVVHSLVIKDMDSGLIISAHNNHTPPHDEWTIEWALIELMNAEEIIGHNILKFDIPAIQKVYPWFKPKGKIVDTLLLSRLIWPDMKEKDFARRAKLKTDYGFDKMNELSPGKLIGSHGLEAWGLRMGEWKGDYSKEKEAELLAICEQEYQDDRAEGLMAKDCRPRRPSKERKSAFVWGTWSQSMQTYCEQDVEVTHKFYNLILSKNYAQRAIDLEHPFAEIIWMMEQEGFPFDVAAGEELERTLMVRKANIEQELQVHFPPWEVRTNFTPKVNNAKLGYVKDKPTFKSKTIVFNPGSRDHIANRLVTLHGWKPKEFTDGVIPGTDDPKPKVDETILKKLPWPEAALITEYLTIQKRLGQLSDGANAWLRLVKNGRIYHSVMTNGAVTGRCTHSRPNLGQVPSVKVGKDKQLLMGYEGGWGAECRALFGPPKGMKQVGADLSGLELRCLAHYMAGWDGGAYIKELLEGDIHTANQLAAGLPTRGNAKTFIYGFLYGAGAEKIGSIVGKGAAAGKKLIEQFLDQTPALKQLRAAVSKKTAMYLKKRDKMGRRIKNPHYKGHLIGLDGRLLPIRHEHAALNTLLQSAGALIAKEATVLLYRDLTTRGYIFGKDYALMAHVHDEVQLWARPEIAEEIGEACVHAFEQAGENFNFKCPITGEYKIGDNWRDTH